MTEAIHDRSVLMSRASEDAMYQRMLEEGWVGSCDLPLPHGVQRVIPIPQIALRLTASNDINGNPRRLWVILEGRQDRVGGKWARPIAVIDEGYRGDMTLREHYPNALSTPPIQIRVSEYRQWINDAKSLATIKLIEG